MTKFRKFTKTFPAADGAKVIRRMYQPVNANGSDSKRPARMGQNELHVYADGSYRYYNRNRVLARQSVSKAVLTEDYYRDLERCGQ